MLACTDPDTLPATVAQAMQQSRQAFGNPAVFLERLITNARHVEVQVFGDGRGTVVTLGDRDCSAQRRRQKVFEEAPAPGLPPATRAALADAARALLEPEAYRSAGTVEFVLDVDTGEFHFLEVNTRLQVEHTVTEATTGIDLVEWMVRAAAGDTAFLRDPPVAVTRPTGHAIEARVYAEDPARDFLPSPGLVTEASWPAGTRVDTWVRAGTEVTPFYDPLLAKVVVHAPTARRSRRRDARRVGAHHRARHRDQLRPPGVVRRQQLVPRRDRHHHDARGAPRSPPPRRRARTGEHHRAGPPGAHRPVARGRPAERAHGRPLVPAREPHPRQPGRRARARVHRVRADAALRRRRHHLPHRRGDGGDVRRRAGRVLRPGPRRREPDPRVRRPLRPRPAHLPARARRVRPRCGARVGVHVHPRRLRRPRRPRPAHRRRPAPRARRRCRCGPSRAGDTCDRPGPVPATHHRVGARGGRRPARRPRLRHRGGHGRVLCHRLAGAPPLVAHGRAAGRAAGRVGTRRRRRSRAPPVERARHAVHRRRGRLHRRHADPARARRPEPRGLHVPGHRDHRRPLEARAAGAG